MFIVQFSCIGTGDVKRGVTTNRLSFRAVAIGKEQRSLYMRGRGKPFISIRVNPTKPDLRQRA